MAAHPLADRPAEVALSGPERIAAGFFGYQRYRVTSQGAAQSREVVRAGKVAAALPLDLARGEIVLIRQFRLPAHLANGCGDLVEIVAGRAEPDEQLADTARRECLEEIGVALSVLVELFSYLTTPGLTDEEVTLFLAGVDSSRVPERTQATEGEQIAVMRVAIDDALAVLPRGTMRNGPLVVALQWLALNRARLPALLNKTKA